MKKIIAVLLLSLSGVAFAQFHGPRHNNNYPRDHWNWVGPTMIGGIIGYEIARNQQTVIIQQPVPIATIPMVQVQTCTPWVEVQNSDGSITRTRTCSR